MEYSEFSWFASYPLVSGKWHLVMWSLNQTHAAGYIDGFKHSTWLKETRQPEAGSDLVNELQFNTNLNAGIVSVWEIQLWSVAPFTNMV